MSNSSWPPELKIWVQECLAKATPSNKAAVNSELKQMLFKAHADGVLNSTDWTKVELKSLQAQSARSNYVPVSSTRPPQPPQIIPPPLTVPPPSYAYTHSPTSSFPAPVSSYSAPQYPYLAAPPPIPPPPPGLASGSNSSALNGHMLAGHVIQRAPEPVPAPPSLPEKKKKKRKKSESKVEANSNKFPTPYHFTSAADEEALARRAARFSKPSSASNSHAPSPGINDWFDGSEDGVSLGMVPGSVSRKKLKGRMGLGYGGEELDEVDPNVMDWDRHTIKGTCTKLEKSYLRLTSEPSPADIRPLHILQQTLQLLKAKWKENHNYAYAVDQFKSMRQDLTVQRIKNEFTVEVYEIHARIALEAKDLGEYNQCQSMLRQLYELGIKGHPQEFLSYRIIYLLHTRNRSDMAALLAQLTPAEKADPSIHHALQVHASLATSNYTKFFRLFSTAPNMSGYIMDHFVERERMNALSIMSKAYLTLPLPHITQILAFEKPTEMDKFLSDHNASIYTNPTLDPAPLTATANTYTKSAWKPIHKPKPTPLEDRIWDAKRSGPMILKGMERYRVVDLKGQVQ